MEFDHVFICVAEPADEAEQLVDFGLVEGTSNHHPGQGTANRRFFFQNAFIEVLFPTDSTELNNELTGPTNLHERFPPKAHHVSPFGVCFRPSKSEPNVPFENWSYRPPYLPEHLDVKVARSPTTEPMWFYLSFGSRPDSVTDEKRQPLAHQCGFRSITSVKVYTPPVDAFSQPATVLNKSSIVEYIEGKEHLLVLGFDNEARGREHDFRPSLPLKFRW